MCLWTYFLFVVNFLTTWYGEKVLNELCFAYFVDCSGIRSECQLVIGIMRQRNCIFLTRWNDLLNVYIRDNEKLVPNIPKLNDSLLLHLLRTLSSKADFRSKNTLKNWNFDKHKLNQEQIKKKKKTYIFRTASVSRNCSLTMLLGDSEVTHYENVGPNLLGYFFFRFTESAWRN